jgi:ATP-dependent 26S proteasome regulatory subunit
MMLLPLLTGLGAGGVKEELQLAVVGAVARPAAKPPRITSGLNEMCGLKPRPPGCGRTLLARALAPEARRAAFASVKTPRLVNKYLGESESAVRSVFRSPRDSTNAVSHRPSAARRDWTGSSTVFVIGPANGIDMIDEAMLRPGRLDKTIEVPLPDEGGRRNILPKHVASLRLKEEIDCATIANRRANATGADLEAIEAPLGNRLMEIGSQCPSGISILLSGN